MTAMTERAPGAVTELPRLLPPQQGPGRQNSQNSQDTQARQGGKRSHDWYAHADRHGRLPYRDQPGVLIRDIEAAGLTGRGGAAFPVHRKLQAVYDAAA